MSPQKYQRTKTIVGASDVDDYFSDGKDKSFEGGKSMIELFRNAMEDMDAVTSDMGIASSDYKQLDDGKLIGRTCVGEVSSGEDS